MKLSTPRLLPWLVFPGLMVSALALHLWMIANDIDLAVSSYTPILFAAGSVTFLERITPYRREWRPEGADLLNDSLYMILVQLALPKLLAITAGLYLLATLNDIGVVFHIWPHTWSVYAQAIVLVMSVSLVRYCVHRASHEWSPLWRLHAVHHSPKKLYWLNLGRFHPLEETLRFSTEALPLMLLGVQAEVLSMYFVVLAVNGFLIHSNIELRHGVLNHVFVTAELHRWHHVREPRRAACNYGNLLIIWDTLFGTRYLPPKPEVGELGLLNRSYPQGFAAQLAAPFITDANGTLTDRSSRKPGQVR